MKQIIRGGRLLDIPRHAAEPADILVEDDTICEIGAPGMAAPADATVLDATGRLLMPGLVNAHTHGHNNLAKSLGDRWTLELLLNAAPWITGGRTLEDKYLSTLIGAVEMVRKGCTAAYDLSFELPAPTPEGLEAVGRAYADAGMRAVVAPMMADRTFHRALPGLLDALPADLRREAEAISLEPFETSLAAWERARSAWPFGRDRVAARPRPHHSPPLQRGVPSLGEPGRRRARCRLPHPPRGVEGPGARRRGALRHDPDRLARFPRSAGHPLHRRARGVARPRRHAPARRRGRGGRPQPWLQRTARQRARGRPRPPRRGGQGRDRDGRVHLLRQSQHVRGDAHRVHGLAGSGARPRSVARDRGDPSSSQPGGARACSEWTTTSGPSNPGGRPTSCSSTSAT